MTPRHRHKAKETTTRGQRPLQVRPRLTHLTPSPKHRTRPTEKAQNGYANGERLYLGSC